MFYGRVSDVYLAVITLTVSLILYSLVRRTSGPDYRIGKSLLGGFNGITSPPLNLPWDASSILLPQHVFHVAMAALIVAYVLTSWLVRTRFGRVCVSIRENELRAELLGYDVRLYKLGIFAVGRGHRGARRGAVLQRRRAGHAGRLQPLQRGAHHHLGDRRGAGARSSAPSSARSGSSTSPPPSAPSRPSTTASCWASILVVFVLAVPKGVVPTIAEWFAARRSRRSFRARERRLRVRQPARGGCREW